jgi:hypothetical protein
MRFSFVVGTGERHRVDFSFDQIWLGSVRVDVNGEVRIRKHQLMGFDPVRTYTLQVGEREKHAVRIEKQKRLLFGGLLPQSYRVFVDDRLVVSIKGY